MKKFFIASSLLLASASLSSVAMSNPCSDMDVAEAGALLVFVEKRVNAGQIEIWRSEEAAVAKKEVELCAGRIDKTLYCSVVPTMLTTIKNHLWTEVSAGRSSLSALVATVEKIAKAKTFCAQN